MNLYANYEEAQLRFESTDLFTVRTLSTVHQSMRSHATCRWRPTAPFDMRFFYEVVLQTVAAQVGHQLEPFAGESCRVEPIHVPNWANEEWASTFFVQSGLATRFTSVLDAHRVDGGCPFDIGFAARIMAEAFDERALAWIHEAKDTRILPAQSDFDSWLEGFSTPVGS